MLLIACKQAPELHPVGGFWHIYFAAEDPRFGNKSHRMYVIVGPPVSKGPLDGPYNFIGPVRGLPDDQWYVYKSHKYKNI